MNIDREFVKWFYEDAYPEPRQDFRVDDHNNENVDTAYNVTENENFNFYPFNTFL